MANIARGLLSRANGGSVARLVFYTSPERARGIRVLAAREGTTISAIIDEALARGMSELDLRDGQDGGGA